MLTRKARWFALECPYCNGAGDVVEDTIEYWEIRRPCFCRDGRVSIAEWLNIWAWDEGELDPLYLTPRHKMHRKRWYLAPIRWFDVIAYWFIERRISRQMRAEEADDEQA